MHSSLPFVAAASLAVASVLPTNNTDIATVYRHLAQLQQPSTSGTEDMLQLRRDQLQGPLAPREPQSKAPSRQIFPSDVRGNGELKEVPHSPKDTELSREGPTRR